MVSSLKLFLPLNVKMSVPSINITSASSTAFNQNVRKIPTSGFEELKYYISRTI